MTLPAQYTLGSPNDHWGNRDGESEVNLLSLDKVDDAAVIYEQDTLKIHCFLILQCHQAVRTLFITLADCNKRKSWEKLKEGGRAAKWQVKSWKEGRRAMSPDPLAEYQGFKAPSSTISAQWRRVLESRVHLSPICHQQSPLKLPRGACLPPSSLSPSLQISHSWDLCMMGLMRSS